jgi:hypothetical protein
MNGKAIRPCQLEMVGFSIKEANKLNISTLLLSVREGVIESADARTIDYPLALLFDPHYQRQ